MTRRAPQQKQPQLSIGDINGPCIGVGCDELVEQLQTALNNQGAGAGVVILKPQDVAAINESFRKILEALEEVGAAADQISLISDEQSGRSRREDPARSAASGGSSPNSASAGAVVDTRNVITVVGPSQKIIDKIKTDLTALPVSVSFLSYEEYNISERPQMGHLIVWSRLGGHDTGWYPDAKFVQQQSGAAGLLRAIEEEANFIVTSQEAIRGVVGSILEGLSSSSFGSWFSKVLTGSLANVARKIGAIRGRRSHTASKAGTTSPAAAATATATLDSSASEGSEATGLSKGSSVFVAGFSDELKSQIKDHFKDSGITPVFITPKEARQLKRGIRNVVLLPVGAGTAAQKLTEAAKIPLFTSRDQILSEAIKLIKERAGRPTER
jgi:hypothetical protein